MIESAYVGSPTCPPGQTCNENPGYYKVPDRIIEKFYLGEGASDINECFTKCDEQSYCAGFTINEVSKFCKYWTSAQFYLGDAPKPPLMVDAHSQYRKIQNLNNCILVQGDCSTEVNPDGWDYYKASVQYTSGADKPPPLFPSFEPGCTH